MNANAKLLAETAPPAAQPARPRTLHIGPLPWPVYLGAVLVTGLACYYQKLPADIIGGLSVLMLGGFLLGKLGQTIPVLNQIGGTAILCLFVPSALVGYGVMPDGCQKAIVAAFKTANFQYFYIACLVAGSILGMPYRVLVHGFLRMFVPLLLGTFAAIGAGIVVGLCFGHGAKDTLFYILVPIFGGGLSEGVLPLSLAYAEILHRPQTELVAQMVPAALIGNVVAIVSSGVLARLGDRRPELSGQGMLVRPGNDPHHDNDLAARRGAEPPISLSLLGAGMLIASGLFLLGGLLAPVTGIPGPVLMIIGAVILKVSRVLPADMEVGAYQINRFMSVNLTFAILCAMGTVLVSWNQLVASFNLGYLVICTTAVVSLIVVGFFVGGWLRMFPVEAAIVTACHSGLGGTGDVAILSAADRLGLMAFAQVSTRVGGALMIVIATFLLRALAS